MYLSGSGELCSRELFSRAANNQGPLTLIFETISCGLQTRAANNRINTVYKKNKVLPKNAYDLVQIQHQISVLL